MSPGLKFDNEQRRSAMCVHFSNICELSIFHRDISISFRVFGKNFHSNSPFLDDNGAKNLRLLFYVDFASSISLHFGQFHFILVNFRPIFANILAFLASIEVFKDCVLSSFLQFLLLMRFDMFCKISIA